jgi:hypothetical protein
MRIAQRRKVIYASLVLAFWLVYVHGDARQNLFTQFEHLLEAEASRQVHTWCAAID